VASENIQKLFAQTLLGHYADEKAWAAINALRSAGAPEVFEYASAWCHSSEALKRARAAAILCQLQRPAASGSHEGAEWVYRRESFELITTMLESENHPMVLESAISGLGHLADPTALSQILPYQNHPDRDVRFAVAFALGCFPNEPESIAALLRLTVDSSADVRDWAVFGLGVQGEADTPEIRETLFRLLSDPDENVREEAAVGLGKRHDERLLPQLRVMLDGPELNVRVADAASALLELDEVPEDWAPADYKDALKRKFNIAEY